MATQNIKELLREFFRLMDMVETTDSGRPFRPNFITSLRVLDGAKLGEILAQLKEYANERPKLDFDPRYPGLGEDDTGI